MIEREISIRTVGQTMRIEQEEEEEENDFHQDLHDMYVRVDV